MLSEFHPLVISRYEKQVRSQNGEAGVLDYLLSLVKHNRSCFEIGASYDPTYDEFECNTGWLHLQEWSFRLLVDSHWSISPPPAHCIQAEVFPESICSQLSQWKVPKYLGVLSIDVDGNDYWIWKAISNEWRPSIVIIEYNGHLDNDRPLIVPRKDGIEWDGSDYFGSNAAAMIALGRSKGYEIVYNCHHLNLFFVRRSLLPSDFSSPIEGVDIDYGPIFRHPTFTGERRFISE